MKKLALFLVSVAFLLPLLAFGSQVTKVVNSVLMVPEKYQCPLTIHFVAEITTDGACTVKYRWVRSDGVRLPVAVLRFARANTRSVTYDWTLPVFNPVPMTQWTKLEILSPNPLLSNLAGACVTCRPK